MYLTKVANVLGTSCSYNLTRTISSTPWIRAMFCTMPAGAGSSHYHISEQRMGECAEPGTGQKIYTVVQSSGMHLFLIKMRMDLPS